MNYNTYQNELERLRDVLKDAVDRGDIYLEYDVIEMIEQLNKDFEGDEE